MNLFYQPDLNGDHLFLNAEESRHAIKVLRLNKGDELNLTDGKGFFYKARIETADSKNCELKVLQKTAGPEKKFSIHIAIAPTKNIDRTEWFVEKAVEMGIDCISFIICDKSERRSVNMDRMSKIAISAMKQSQQSRLPQLSLPIRLTELFATPAHQKFIAHVDHQNPHHLHEAAKKGSQYLVLIGPEGDFSQKELDEANNHKFQKVSLGPNRLRTETAALAACQTLNLINW